LAFHSGDAGESAAAVVDHCVFIIRAVRVKRPRVQVRDVLVRLASGRIDQEAGQLGLSSGEGIRQSAVLVGCLNHANLESNLSGVDRVHGQGILLRHHHRRRACVLAEALKTGHCDDGSERGDPLSCEVSLLDLHIFFSSS